MTILVTGGAGFIGTNFLFYMRCHHSAYRLVCVDKLTYAGDLSSLQPLLADPDFRFVQLDICDRQGIEALFASERPDVVVNFAAESHVDRSINDAEAFLQTNVLGTQVLLDVCVRYGVKRFHQVSTDEVYGDLPLHSTQLLGEDAPLRPSSPYAASKAAADLLVLSYRRTYGLDVTISRCSNNYGPYQHPEKLIPRMLANALQDQPLPVYGRGENVRDWLYVEDHCAAIDWILHKASSGAVYNIAAGNERRNIDIVKSLCRILGKPESLITYVPDRKGHDLRYGLDDSALRKASHWQPQMPFAQGLGQTVDWYLQNRPWWQGKAENK